MRAGFLMFIFFIVSDVWIYRGQSLRPARLTVGPPPQEKFHVPVAAALGVEGDEYFLTQGVKTPYAIKMLI
jgi:hypothetical protein